MVVLRGLAACRREGSFVTQPSRSFGTDYSDYWRPAPEGRVLVRRGHIDDDVWCCTAVDMVLTSQALKHPVGSEL